MNYFQLLGLEERYDVDIAKLQKQYLTKQAQYHPDRASNETERREFLELSMSLNEAQKVLKDDYMRAEYLLKLKGQNFDDHALKNVLSLEELEEVMEASEALEKCENLGALKAMQQEKLKAKKLIVAELVSCFARNDLKKALDLKVRLKYLTNLVNNINLKIKHANNRDQ